MIVFLIGFMGSGKSATGRKLARKLGYTFVDMDDCIEKKTGMPVRKIFRKKGEAKFRKMERRLLEKLVRKDDLVVATGGGVPCGEGNMDLIKRHGTSVYLKMDPSLLFERLKTRQAKRPLIRELSEKELMKFIRSKLAEREAFYMQADHIVDGSKRDADELVGLLNG